MFSLEIKNTLAKILIICWIAFLMYVAGEVIKTALNFDVNTYFQVTQKNALPQPIVQEIRLIILMLAVAIIGGVSYLIKDFYRANKYSNIYSTYYEDRRNGNISAKEFQRLVTIEIYTGRFNHTWLFWFLVQPILSSALGVIAFFIARSGLWLVQGTTFNGEITIQAAYMYAVLTYLAGFSSHKFIAWLDRLADKIFSTTLPEDKKSELREDIISATEEERQNLKREVDSLSISGKNATLTVEPNFINEKADHVSDKNAQTAFDENTQALSDGESTQDTHKEKNQKKVSDTNSSEASKKTQETSLKSVR